LICITFDVMGAIAKNACRCFGKQPFLCLNWASEISKQALLL